MNLSSHLLFRVLQRWHACDGQVWVPLLQRPCWWHLQMEGRERLHSRSRSHNLKHDTPQRCRRLRCTGKCRNNLFINAENMLSFSFMFKLLHRSLAPKVGLAWPQFMIPTVTLIWLNWPRASKSNFRPLPGNCVWNLLFPSSLVRNLANDKVPVTSKTVAHFLRVISK